MLACEGLGVYVQVQTGRIGGPHRSAGASRADHEPVNLSHATPPGAMLCAHPVFMTRRSPKQH